MVQPHCAALRKPVDSVLVTRFLTAHTGASERAELQSQPTPLPTPEFQPSRSSSNVVGFGGGRKTGHSHVGVDRRRSLIDHAAMIAASSIAFPHMETDKPELLHDPRSPLPLP